MPASRRRGVLAVVVILLAALPLLAMLRADGSINVVGASGHFGFACGGRSTVTGAGTIESMPCYLSLPWPVLVSYLALAGSLGLLIIGARQVLRPVAGVVVLSLFVIAIYEGGRIWAGYDRSVLLLLAHAVQMAIFATGAVVLVRSVGDGH